MGWYGGTPDRATDMAHLPTERRHEQTQDTKKYVPSLEVVWWGGKYRCLNCETRLPPGWSLFSHLHDAQNEENKKKKKLVCVVKVQDSESLTGKRASSQPNHQHGPTTDEHDDGRREG